VSLIAGIGPILARAGLLELLEARADRGEGVVRKAGIVFHWGSREGEGSWSADFRDARAGRPPVSSYHVDRATFDQLLLDHASSLGATVHEGARVEEVRRVGPSWHVRFELDGARHEALAAHVVDASGLSRVLSRALGIRRVGFDDMSNHALHGYWRGSAKKEHGSPLADGTYWTFISTTTDGWCWHIPLGPDLVSVGLVTSEDALPSGGAGPIEDFYVRNVRACHGIGDLLADATLDHHPLAPRARRVLSQRDWSSHAERLSTDGAFLVGDAALFVDPILTSGVVLSAIGASLAAGALHTLWNDPDVDSALLRESYDETYLDLALGYHRVAQIWYRRNDKVQSWWWQARRAALRSDSASTQLDMRAFLAMTLGLVRDPFAGLAAQREGGLDVVRPDKLLLAQGVVGADAGAVERALLDRLAEITRDHADEGEARTLVHRHLLARWRRRLERALSLAHLEVRARERYYSDRTMAGWKRTRLVEVRARGSADLLDRVILPAGADPGAPLGVPLQEASLRASLEAATAHLPTGSHARRRLVHAAWERLVQLDVMGLLPSESQLDAADEAIAPESLETVVWLARTLAEPSERVGIIVDLLGSSMDVVTTGRRLLVVPREGDQPVQAYATTARCAVSYLDGTLEPTARASLDRALDRVRAAEPRARWGDELRAVAGESLLLDGLAITWTTPDRVRALSDRRTQSEGA